MQKNSIQTLSKLAVPLVSKGRFFREKKTHLRHGVLVNSILSGMALKWLAFSWVFTNVNLRSLTSVD